jgi:uncharacterized protein
VPLLTAETARQKVQAAEDGWNTRDPERVAAAYTDPQWRNRDELFQGREAIVAFLDRKGARELEYRLRKFDEHGLMRRRDASINDYRIEEGERRIVPR